MKQYKIYTKGNYIVIVDTQLDEYFYGIRKEVHIDKSNVNKPLYKAFNVKDFSSSIILAVPNILKEDGTPYSEAEFDTFYQGNTGNFNGGGTAPEFIPLSGTEVGSPVSGNIEIIDGVSIIPEPLGGAYYLGDINKTALGITVDGITVASNSPLLSRGLTSEVDFTPNITDLDYTQKKYVDTKVPKDSTAGVERAYIINPDGSQATKATSKFKDVLEFANFSSFPTTGETGIIYVALDKNFTYRWTGSAYVQIGGINQDLYPIKYWYQATGTGIGTYGTNVMFIQGTQSDVFGGNGLSYRKIASAATAGTSIFAREASFARVSPNKGFQFLLRFRIADAATISGVRGFHGLQVTSGFGNTDISANTQLMCGIGCDGTDTNIHIFSRQSTFGTLVKIDTGFSKTLNHEYLLTQKRLPNSNDVVFTLKNLTTSTEFTSTVVNNSFNLTIVNHRNNNASTLSCGFEIQRQELNLSE